MQCEHAYIKGDSKYIYCNIESTPSGIDLDDTTPAMCFYQDFPPGRWGNRTLLANWSECVKLRAAIDRTKTVLPTDWAADGTYTDYPYRAAIPMTGATTDMFPYVEFQQNEAESGNYADVSITYDGGVYIYCKEPPEAAITVDVYLYVEEDDK